MSLQSQTAPAPVDVPALPAHRVTTAEPVVAPTSPIPEPFANWDGAAQWLTPRAPAPSPIHRLVVLVPGPYVDETSWARRIWAIASPRSLRVLYLGLGRRGEQEAPLRRTLATLAALTRDQEVPVAHHVAFASGWIAAVRGVWRPGDLAICQSEHTVRAWGRHKSLGASLHAALDVPVGVLAGLAPPTARTGRTVSARLAKWLVPASIVVGFTWLQAQLARLPADSLQTLLLALTVVVEFALIAAWDQLLG